MGTLNDFRLSQETALLFVLSYEYGIPFAKMLAMYEISDKMFWAYVSLLSPMSKMGVRKGSQLAKMANRLYKASKGIKEKIHTRVEVDVINDDGELVYDDKGSVLKERKTKVDVVPIILSEIESNIKAVMDYFTTHGYSNGENFYSDTDIMDMRVSLAGRGDAVKIDNEVYTGCTHIEFMMEKYFPEMTLSEYRMLSIKDIGNMLSTVNETEQALDETELVPDETRV